MRQLKYTLRLLLAILGFIPSFIIICILFMPEWLQKEGEFKEDMKLYIEVVKGFINGKLED